MTQSAQRYPHLARFLGELECLKDLLARIWADSLGPTISSIESLMERRVRHTLRPGTVRISVLARDQASEGGESKRPFKLLPFHTNACDQRAHACSNPRDVG